MNDTVQQSQAASEPSTGQVGRPRRRRWWLRALVAVSVLYVGWCALLYSIQDTLIFPADMAAAPLSRPVRLPVQTLTRTLPDGGEVEAWFWPAPTDAAGRARPLVVFFHGNAEIIDHQDHVVGAYRQMGCHVLLPEYRGYGHSGGRPSQAAIREDAQWFLEQILARPEVDGKRLIYHGRSLGGGAACDLARIRPPEALVLESTFATLAEMAHGHGAPEFLVRHPFRSEEFLRTYKGSVLIMHGTHDRIVPVEHARRMRSAATSAAHVEYIEYPCDHNDFPGAGNSPAMWDQVRAFLGSAELLDPENR